MTDTEKERLYMLAEEASEVIQIVNKILRHGYNSYGYNSYHPSDLMKTPNSVLLQQELIDLLCIVDRMNYLHDIDINMEDTELLDETWQKKLKYTRHQNY